MGKKIISFSLWGNARVYNIGALENVKRASEIYPGWTTRIYVAKDSPVLSDLKKLDCELVVMEPESAWIPLFWRFYAASDPTVERVIFRDCDSRINTREAAAVAEWEKLGADGHLMKDAEPHTKEIMLAGMWGIKGGLVKNMPELVKDWVSKSDICNKYTDQMFLNSVIWPTIKPSATIHGLDSQAGPARPFPPHAPARDCEYVGMPVSVPSKVLVLVLAADVLGYDRLIKGIRDTWASNREDESFKTLYYYGRREGFPNPPDDGIIQLDDTLICGCAEEMPSILLKTLLTYEYIYDRYDFDYVFRCCCGSYVVRDDMMRFLSNKPASKFYCGIIGPGNPPFASGSGYFLSRDLVAEIVKPGIRQKIRDYPYPGSFDDVAIGKFMNDLGIGIDPNATRIDFSTNVIPGVYHYHMGKNGDGRPMYEIHEKLTGKKMI
jgi:hypothetical protein